MTFISCDIKDNKEVSPESEFQKIYDNQLFTQSFEALSLVETTDKGFIVYGKTKSSSSNFGNCFLIRTDKLGNFSSSINLPTNVVSPIANIFKVDNHYYVFAMDNTSLESVLVKFDENLTIISQTKIPESYYPLASNIDLNKDLLLLTYDRENRESVVFKVGVGGQIISKQNYSVGYDPFDPEPRILDHLIGTQSKLPFLVGQLQNGKYYFNGFINFSLSCTFFTFGQETVPAILQGYKDQKGVSSLINNPSGDFSISQFSSNGIKISPKVELNTQTFSSLDNVVGFDIVEFSKQNIVISKPIDVNGEQLNLFASPSNNNYSVVYFYRSDGSFYNSLRVGSSNKHQISDVISTSDQGLVTCGTVYLDGKLPRVFIYKYSTKEMF